MTSLKTLSHRLFNLAKLSTTTSFHHHPLPRFLQTSTPLPATELPINHSRKTNPPKPPAEEKKITMADVRKLVKAAKMEVAREKLRATGRACVLYSEFVELCGSEALAMTMVESGAVVVLGDVVVVRPEVISKAVEDQLALSSTSQHKAETAELKAMEQQKLEIDKKAESLAKREMWLGLGFLMMQTAGFIRLTFWELSWDIMEPICFSVTSLYIVAGYAFFLTTSREPSLEAIFASRFPAKQKQLMKARNFNVDRYNELVKKNAQLNPGGFSQLKTEHFCSFSSANRFGSHRRTSLMRYFF